MVKGYKYRVYPNRDVIAKMARDMANYTLCVENSIALPQVALPDYGSGFFI